MNVKLEKWYLDFTAKNEIGFYYIMCLTIGRFKIGFSGINHFDPERSAQSFRFSRFIRPTIHGMDSSRARLTTNLNQAQLKIDHGKTSITGSWSFLSPPVKRWRKPLYSNSDGWVDWKIWTPLAEVKLLFSHKKTQSALSGTGYIDFVRMTLPFWKLPFQVLYWGRMHSPPSWSVFLDLKTKDERISIYLDQDAGTQEAVPDLQRNQRGEALALAWTLGPRERPRFFKSQVLRILEVRDILDRIRALSFLPTRLKRLLSSSGRDEKYRMKARFQSRNYHGIMEEVRYHD